MYELQMHIDDEAVNEHPLRMHANVCLIATTILIKYTQAYNHCECMNRRTVIGNVSVLTESQKNSCMHGYSALKRITTRHTAKGISQDILMSSSLSPFFVCDAPSADC